MIVRKIGHAVQVTVAVLQDVYGDVPAEPECLACDIATARRETERGARLVELRQHEDVLRSASVDALAFARLLRDQRAAVEDGLPPRCCVDHLVAGVPA